MFCVGCGNKLNNSDTFCNNCGSKTPPTQDGSGLSGTALASNSSASFFAVLAISAVSVILFFFSWYTFYTPRGSVFHVSPFDFTGTADAYNRFLDAFANASANQRLLDNSMDTLRAATFTLYFIPIMNAITAFLLVTGNGNPAKSAKAYRFAQIFMAASAGLIIFLLIGIAVASGTISSAGVTPGAPLFLALLLYVLGFFICARAIKSMRATG